MKPFNWSKWDLFLHHFHQILSHVLAYFTSKNDILRACRFLFWYKMSSICDNYIFILAFMIMQDDGYWQMLSLAQSPGEDLLVEFWWCWRGSPYDRQFPYLAFSFRLLPVGNFVMGYIDCPSCIIYIALDCV